MRPSTLAEAIERIVAGEPREMALPEFLDAFYLAATAELRLRTLADAPPITGDARLPVLDDLGVAAALITTVIMGVAFSTFDNALTLNDLVMGLAKPVMFGFILSSVGCHMGLRTSGGTQGVGLATTRSVVVASVLILASDFFITKVLLLLFPVT